MFGRKAYNRCPVDHEPLVLCELEGIEIDYCPRCGGCWIDRGELDLICARASAEPVEKALTGETAPSDRRCPRCTREMESVQRAGVRIERCRRGDGYWLDRGELELLIANSSHAATAFLADMMKFKLTEQRGEPR